jgi:hypothetical protein
MSTERDDEPEDFDRLREALIRREISINEFIRRAGTLKKLTKGRTEEQQ